MDKIKQLEIKKLLKELEFVESDYDYKSEAMSIYDAEFMSQVDKFLETRPDLKEKYETKVNKDLDEAVKKQVEQAENYDSENLDEFEENENKTSEEKSPKLKKLYREIAKITHPDRVKDKKLNDWYIEATEYYEDNDLSGLYFICDQLGIEYEVDEDDNQLISTKIGKLKDRIQFMESTYTWMWYSADNDLKKEMLIMNYIQMQMAT
jgi:hypothetical protein